MLLLSVLGKFGVTFSNFLFSRAKGGCIPLNTKHSMTEFVSPLQESHGGTEVAS